MSSRLVFAPDPGEGLFGHFQSALALALRISPRAFGREISNVS
jgi:hypothetical protein